MDRPTYKDVEPRVWPNDIYDHTADFEQGREDAMNGFPRASTRPFYRKGYDKGLTATLTA
jgi:hypothetical protein